MLIEFKVKNFRSFRDEQVFSMVANSDDSHPENTFETPAFPKHKLLTTAAIYGANASGKTNLIKALSFVEGFVSNSHERKIGSSINVTPFLLDKASAESPAEFELTFVHKGTRYQYGFILDTTKVIEEWLIAYPSTGRSQRSQLWFERKNPIPVQSDETQLFEYTWHFGSNLKGENRSIANQTRSNVLFLSKAADSNHQQLLQVYNWFSDCLDTYVGIQELSPGASARMAIEDASLKGFINELITSADFGISNVGVEEKPVLIEDLPEELPKNLKDFLMSGKSLEITIFHSTNDISKPFSFDEESMGTQRVFALAGLIFRALQEGRVLIVDELDASLHPFIVRGIVNLFHNPEFNKKGGQLIFNTHDTTLLDTNFLRRDQVWLVEKDKEGASHLYPLLDFKPRKPEPLQKRYLEGFYGAIPMLQGMLQGE